MADTTNESTDEYGVQFAEAVDEYLAKSYDGDRRRQLLEAGGWDAAFAGELSELGWYTLVLPAEHGGLGAGLGVLGPVFAQLGRHLVTGPQLESFLLPALLPEVADPSASVALVDPGVTDDWQAELGSVTLRDGRLDGTVHAVRFALQASRLLVVATTGTGEVLCAVDLPASGARVEGVGSSDPGTLFGRVGLAGVEAHVVGDAELVTRLRAWARLLLACELSGLAHRSVELTVSYLGQREQFGRPIGSFQALKHIAADMHATWSGLDSLCRATVDDAGRASLAELDLLGAAAKAHAADAALRVCENAIQLHGGMGFTTDAEVGWYYRRVLGLRAWYGDPTELQRRIGAAALKRSEATKTPQTE